MRRIIPRTSGLIAAVLAVTVIGLGCATTSKDEEPADTPAASDTDSEFQAREESPPVQAKVVETAKLSLDTAYFAFDVYALDPVARSVARANGEQIKSAGARILLEGNCDERGSEEYNFALGERRANSVKSYLTDLGVPASKIRTVSYGETNPAAEGNNESAWRYNRRVDFKVTR